MIYLKRSVNCNTTWIKLFTCKSLKEDTKLVLKELAVALQTYKTK